MHYGLSFKKYISIKSLISELGFKVQIRKSELQAQQVNVIHTSYRNYWDKLKLQFVVLNFYQI